MQQTQGWNELSQKMGQLKLQASDGKYYRTDAADTATILRIIQSIPSPNAEPIRLWLIKVGAKELLQTYDIAGSSLGSSIAEAWNPKTQVRRVRDVVPKKTSPRGGLHG
jgi:hypothetical protein